MILWLILTILRKSIPEKTMLVKFMNIFQHIDKPSFQLILVGSMEQIIILLGYLHGLKMLMLKELMEVIIH